MGVIIEPLTRRFDASTRNESAGPIVAHPAKKNRSAMTRVAGESRAIG
jgi:hypothetical protein